MSTGKRASPATEPGAGSATSSLMWPREHGAWAMMAFPFVSAIILARNLDWLMLPAALAVLTTFSVREPLVELGRQAFIRHCGGEIEAARARRCLAVCLAVLAVAGAALFGRREWRVILALGAGAFGLLGAAVVLSVLNRQRSVWLQCLSSIGLSASALMGWLSAQPQLDRTALWLWASHSLYSAAAVLVVRARIDVRVAMRRVDQGLSGVRSLRTAVAAQLVLLLAGVTCLASGAPLLTLALTVVAGAHFLGLWSLRRPESNRIPLRRVGLRALGLSVAYSTMVVAALW